MCKSGHPCGSAGSPRSSTFSPGLCDAAEQVPHLASVFSWAGIGGEVVELVRVGLMVIQLGPGLAAVPFGVAVALGVDAVAHDALAVLASA